MTTEPPTHQKRSSATPSDREQPDQTSLFASTAPLPVTHLDDDERIACLRLIRSTNVGPTTFRELINHYGGAKQALEALPKITQAASAKKRFEICTEEDAVRELETAKQAGARPLFTIEPGYPQRLAQLAAPPPLIYVKGNDELLNKPTLAIVGARQASAAGIKLAQTFAARLSAQGLVIVSGLARGIDGAAHTAALKNGTIAVVAGGVDVVYPPEHVKLHDEIAQTGCILSEMPCGFKPRAKDFPRRNRLISGLSLGVLVVEAAKRSGSLGTARLAGEQGRDVFAIPGHPLDPRATGTNALLKDGATLVTEPADVLEHLTPLTQAPDGPNQFREPRTQPFRPNTSIPTPHDIATNDTVPNTTKIPAPSSQQVVDQKTACALVRESLGIAPLDVDSLTRATNLTAQQIRTALFELELAGEIQRHGANLVSRTAT